MKYSEWFRAVKDITLIINKHIIDEIDTVTNINGYHRITYKHDYSPDGSWIKLSIINIHPSTITGYLRKEKLEKIRNKINEKA